MPGPFPTPPIFWGKSPEDEAGWWCWCDGDVDDDDDDDADDDDGR